jgi:putative transposase
MWVCDPPVRSCLNLLSASPGVFQPGSGRRRSSLPAIGPPPVRESASIARRPTARTECPRRPPLHRFSTFLRFSRRSGLASGSECQGCGRRARRELHPLAVYEPDRAHLLHVRHCTKITRGPGSRDAGKAARDRTRLPSFAFKFTPFDTVLTANNIKIIRTPVRAPRANAIAERLVCTIRRELLDRLPIINQRHAKGAPREYQQHHNHHRPHPRPGRSPYGRHPSPPNPRPTNVRRQARLGGLLPFHRGVGRSRRPGAHHGSG